MRRRIDVAATGVAAALVTRGDVPLADLLRSLYPVLGAPIVWDNSVAERDEKVLGRYLAAQCSGNRIAYTQDDDAICPAQAILGAYSGEQLLVNVPSGEKPWFGWGAVFDVEAALTALDRYETAYPDRTDDLLRWPDVIVASFLEWRSVDLGHVDLPWATARNRMYFQVDHSTSQEEVENRCRAIGGATRRS